MNQKQVDLIIKHRFRNLGCQVGAACRAVILEGITAYAAENRYNCKRGTVSRHVNKIYAELSFCREVVSHDA